MYIGLIDAVVGELNYIHYSLYSGLAKEAQSEGDSML